jgi:hypothetical protein
VVQIPVTVPFLRNLMGTAFVSSAAQDPNPNNNTSTHTLQIRPRPEARRGVPPKTP